MKLSKKILAAFSVAAMLVVAGSFTACKESEDDDDAISGENVSAKNETDMYYRAFESLKTKHKYATANIKINNPTEVVAKGSNGELHSANSVIGYVFGLEEDKSEHSVTKAYQYQKDGTLKEKTITWYNFAVAGVRWNNKTSKLEWYVSYCEGVPNTIFGYNDSSDFTAKIITEVDSDGKAKTSVDSGATEKAIVGTLASPYFESIDTTSYSLPEDGIINVLVDVTIEGDETNGYYYNVELQNQQGVTIEGASVGKIYVNGLTETTQKEIGRYTTVYSGETANASISFQDVQGNPIPVSEDDWVDLSK
ncbi:MAG: hypothetical protein J6I53_00010 [Treponema sp.]|nr:hypothetical protein [Treponema sp.]